ncbi:MAG: hypothetical protein WCI39_09640 [Gallionellaceae bacterium]
MNEKIVDIAPLIKQTNDGLSVEERTALEKGLVEKLEALRALPVDKKSDSKTLLQRVRLQLDVAENLNALDRKMEAWSIAYEAFHIALDQESWQDAVEACNVLFQTSLVDALAALGMGIWLSVTFPVNPELTMAMLVHVVDETPDNSDGAALAAITARYVVDLRADDEQHENLSFFADNLIAMVAKRHSKVQDQEGMNKWLDKLALRDPQVFLPRLGKVVDVLVEGKWWFDRDALRSKLPN